MSTNIFSLVKDKISILDVIGHHVTLKKHGTYWKGSCPFHSEKTASFTVSPHREIFYCFGCHETGDAISFISKIENCNQVEAVKLLADRYGISLPETSFSSAEGGSTNFDEKKRYNLVCSAFAQWCHTQLLNDETAHTYVLSRGISSESIQTFKLGYFPHGTTASKQLIQALHKENLLLKDLSDAGIVSEGKTIYSSFEQRIIFPIKDHMGNFCGFGGRVFKPGDERSKYYNSSENRFFQKGSLLFGLDMAKREIQAKNVVFLVEGYTDCIMMHQHGYKNTVATLGTACTIEHLKTLAHYAHTVLVLYDGDAAGRKAMLRLTQLCWQVDLELKMVMLPTGLDPASFLVAGKNMNELVADAQEIFDFFLNDLGKDFSSAPLKQKLSVVRGFLDIIKKIENSLKQDILLQKAAAVFNIPVGSLKKEMGYTRAVSESQLLEVKEDPLAGLATLEKKFMCAIIIDPQLLEKDSVRRLVQYLPDGLQQVIKKIITHQLVQGTDQSFESNDAADFVHMLDEQEKRIVNRLLVAEEEQEKFEHLEMLLEKKYWKKIVHDTKLQLEHAQAINDQKTVQKIIGSFLDLKKKLLHKGLI